MTAVSTACTAPRPRSSRPRLRVRLVQAGLSACGLAALAWASFVQPLPRLVYNPSDSVSVGWYRVEPLHQPGDSLPHPLSVGSIVLTRLPADAAALAAQRGYLPARVPLPSWRQCRQLRPGELFLLSVTNPASFDSRYFGPVSASAVIGVAHPVWLESRP